MAEPSAVPTGIPAVSGSRKFATALCENSNGRAVSTFVKGRSLSSARGTGPAAHIPHSGLPSQVVRTIVLSTSVGGRRP